MMHIRRLTIDEHHLVPDLYQRTYGRPRSEEHQQWLGRNPMGPPFYFGAFENDTLYGLTGLMPWQMEDKRKAWQIGEVLVDPVQRGQGLFSRILKFIFDDNKYYPLDGPIYTLPNLASEPGFKKYSPLTRYEIPRWTLWLKAQSSPLKKLGPFAGLASFLLPDFSPASELDWKPFEKFTGERANFLNWRFGPDNHQPWNLFGFDQYECTYQVQASSDCIQIGLWPGKVEFHESFVDSIVKQHPDIGRIEWAGQATSEQEESLIDLGFRTSLLNKPTWRNALYIDDSQWEKLHRLHFDT